jgi:phenol hydroxylase P0 protein
MGLTAINTMEEKVDDQQRYIRVTGTRNNQFVEFDFSIGDPTIFIELILPFDQFHEFCKKQKAIELTVEQSAAVDYDSLKWRFGKPGLKE